MTTIEIVFYDAVKHRHFLPAIVNLHIESIEFDNSLLRYHPPFTQEKRDKMSKFWEERIDQVVNSRRIIFLALAQLSDGKSEQELAGLVELGMPEADTGPFRGDVEMLMVSTGHRNHGVGKRLMHELERVAVEKGRTLLQLSTTVGSVAEKFVYPRLGYVKFGIVPNYGIVPVSGEMVDGAYFYKDLRD